MHATIRVPATAWQTTREWLLGSPDERMAYMLARASLLDDPWHGSHLDLLVGCAVLVPDAALVAQSPVRIEVDPSFTRVILLCCYETGLSLIDVHTHPFSSTSVGFSGTDERNMRQTHAEFGREIPQDPPALAASLVIGRGSVTGAWLPPGTGNLAAIDRMVLTGERITEVTLC